jgi:hypothetical protein
MLIFCGVLGSKFCAAAHTSRAVTPRVSGARDNYQQSVGIGFFFLIQKKENVMKRKIIAN